jgi:aldose 1-epimerase
VTSDFSGEQYELEWGSQRAVVTEVGGGLRTYTVDGRDVLDGYRLDELCPSGRGQVLIPWPNRIEDGHYEFGGRTHQLALTEPTASNAIHGLVQWDAWLLRDRLPHRIVLEHMLHPQPGYPFALASTLEYSLGDDGLTVTMSATNEGREPCPFGMGMHPYLTLGAPVDGLTLTVPAATVLMAGEGERIATRPTAVAGGAFDFRAPRLVGATVLDHCFTDLDRDPDGRARIVLAGDDRAVTVWVDETFGDVMLYSGDDRPDVARRALAIEPMTCPPNAFRTGTSLAVLPPRGSLSASWGVATTPLSPQSG